jgi:hypothetical protein
VASPDDTTADTACAAPIEATLDALYRLPRDEFISTRDARAQALEREGDPEGARRVRGCKKPNAAAWAINIVWWSDPSAFTPLFDATRRLYEAHVGTDAAARTRAERVRRAELQRLTRAATSALSSSGAPTSAAVQRKITTTLEAVSGREPGSEPALGRLVVDLEAPGFEVLAGAAVSATAASPDDAGAAALARTEARASKARREAVDAARRAQEASDALAEIDAELARAQEALRLARARADELRATRAAAAEHADACARESTRAAAAADDADAAHRDAQSRVRP